MSYLKRNLIWFKKLKRCRVSGEHPTIRHQDGDKFARPAGRPPSRVIEAEGATPHLGAVELPLAVHGTLSATEKDDL